jgi:hypothetical protein
MFSKPSCSSVANLHSRCSGSCAGVRACVWSTEDGVVSTHLPARRLNEAGASPGLVMVRVSTAYRS